MNFTFFVLNLGAQRALTHLLQLIDLKEGSCVGNVKAVLDLTVLRRQNSPGILDLVRVQESVKQSQVFPKNVLQAYLDAFAVFAVFAKSVHCVSKSAMQEIARVFLQTSHQSWCTSVCWAYEHQ